MDRTYKEESENIEGDRPTATTADGRAEEREIQGKAFSAAKLQSQLCQLQDCTRLRIFEATLKEQCHWDQLEILRDCRHAQTSHF